MGWGSGPPIPEGCEAEEDEWYAERATHKDARPGDWRRRLHRRPSCRRVAPPRTKAIRAVDCKPLAQWYQIFRDVENRQLDLPSGCVRTSGERRRLHLQSRRRHGRHGLHRATTRALHVERAHQHAPADGGARRGSEGFSIPPRPASTTRTSSGIPTSLPSRKRTRIPRCPKTATAGRSCSASACAAISWRTSASRPASRATTMSTGRMGTYDGGREKAPAAICRKVIQAKALGQTRDRDLGRWRADPQLHVHRRLRPRHAAHHAQRRHRARSTSAAASWSPSTSSWTSWRTSRA